MNLLKKIILAIALIFPVMVGVASASNWADPNQFFDDTINGGVSQYPANIGSATYVSPNIVETLGSNYVYAANGAATPANFIWTMRFRSYNPSGYVYLAQWNSTNSGGTYNAFVISGGNIYGQVHSGNITGASTLAIPSSCYSTTAVPSGWCWAKIIRNGTTASIYIATDTNGGPGTFTQYQTSSSFDAGTTYPLAFGTNNGALQIGGNYPCVMHVSTNTNYDCFAARDTNMQFDDSFWTTATYNYGSTPSLSGNVLTVSGQTNAAFEPFGSSITVPSNFVWETRINSDNTSSGYAWLGMFGSSINSNGLENQGLELIHGYTTNSDTYYLRYTGAAGSSNTNLTFGTVNPTPPFYVKVVYNAPNMTIYYAPTTSAPVTNLTWQTLIPSTNVSAYLGSSSAFSSHSLGALFSYEVSGATITAGGSNTFPCQNYISNNVGFDCFNNFNQKKLHPAVVH